MRIRLIEGARKTDALLWAAQALLALAFVFAGGMKLVMPVEALTAGTKLPGAFMRVVGVLEVLGGLGLVLPGLLRTRVVLTPLAAAGLVLVMAGATGATMATLGGAGTLVPVAFGTLLVLVAVGRWRFAHHETARVPGRRAAVPAAV